MVLGAWGCGAFGNDPTLVATAMKAALHDFRGHLSEVVFAVPGHKENLGAFSRVFAGATQHDGRTHRRYSSRREDKATGPSWLMATGAKHSSSVCWEVLARTTAESVLDLTAACVSNDEQPLTKDEARDIAAAFKERLLHDLVGCSCISSAEEVRLRAVLPPLSNLERATREQQKDTKRGPGSFCRTGCCLRDEYARQMQDILRGLIAR